MSRNPQYGERGFVPTVTDHSKQGSVFILHTLDARQETDLVSKGDGEICRVANTVTDEQSDVLGLYERN